MVEEHHRNQNVACLWAILERLLFGLRCWDLTLER
jgi:hypothetical protein